MKRPKTQDPGMLLSSLFSQQYENKVRGAGEDAKDTLTGHDKDRITIEAGQKTNLKHHIKIRNQ